MTKWVKCKNQKEWICDVCGHCGDRSCCPGTHFMYRIPRTDDCLCTVCLGDRVISTDPNENLFLLSDILPT